MSNHRWIDYLADRKNCYESLISVALLGIVLAGFSQFLGFVENRPGALLNDPVLRLFAPIELTWLIFPLLYGSLITALVLLSATPGKLVFTLQLYTVVLVSRMVVMYLLPLDPPAQMIILRDPIVEFFAGARTPTRDLFFSGHTATMFILFLSAESKNARTGFLLITVLVAIALLAQHVHYTVDVVAAFFFAYACNHLLNWLKRDRQCR